MHYQLLIENIKSFYVASIATIAWLFLANGMIQNWILMLLVLIVNLRIIKYKAYFTKCHKMYDDYDMICWVYPRKAKALLHTPKTYGLKSDKMVCLSEERKIIQLDEHHLSELKNYKGIQYENLCIEPLRPLRTD